MNEEFRRTAPNTATSTGGFTVRWNPNGSVTYQDPSGEWELQSELLTQLLGILVYEKTGGLASMNVARRNELLSDLKRALEYMGHRVEFWNDGLPETPLR
jgi:hypothetical protein